MNLTQYIASLLLRETLAGNHHRNLHYFFTIKSSMLKVGVRGTIEEFCKYTEGALFKEGLFRFLGLQVERTDKDFHASVFNKYVYTNHIPFPEKDEITLYYNVTKSTSQLLAGYYYSVLLEQNEVDFLTFVSLVSQNTITDFLRLYSMRLEMKNAFLRIVEKGERIQSDYKYVISQGKRAYIETSIDVQPKILNEAGLFDRRLFKEMFESDDNEAKKVIEKILDAYGRNYAYNFTSGLTLIEMLGFEAVCYFKDSLFRFALRLNVSEKYNDDVLILAELAKYYRKEFDLQINGYEQLVEQGKLFELPKSYTEIFETRAAILRDYKQKNLRTFAKTRRLIYKQGKCKN